MVGAEIVQGDGTDPVKCAEGAFGEDVVAVQEAVEGLRGDERRVGAELADGVQHALPGEFETGAVEARLQQDLLDQGDGLVVVPGHDAPRDAETGRSGGHAHRGAQEVDGLLQLLGGALRGAFQHGLGEQVGDPGAARLLEEHPAPETEFELHHGGLPVLDAQDRQPVLERLAPHVGGAHAGRRAEGGLGGAVEGTARGAFLAPHHGEFGLGPLHDRLDHDLGALGALQRQLRLAAGHERAGHVRPDLDVGVVDAHHVVGRDGQDAFEVLGRVPRVTREDGVVGQLEGLAQRARKSPVESGLGPRLDPAQLRIGNPLLFEAAESGFDGREQVVQVRRGVGQRLEAELARELLCPVEGRHSRGEFLLLHDHLVERSGPAVGEQPRQDIEGVGIGVVARHGGP